MGFFPGAWLIGVGCSLREKQPAAAFAGGGKFFASLMINGNCILITSLLWIYILYKLNNHWQNSRFFPPSFFNGKDSRPPFSLLTQEHLHTPAWILSMNALTAAGQTGNWNCLRSEEMSYRYAANSECENERAIRPCSLWCWKTSAKPVSKSCLLSGCWECYIISKHGYFIYFIVDKAIIFKYL